MASKKKTTKKTGGKKARSSKKTSKKPARKKSSRKKTSRKKKTRQTVTGPFTQLAAAPYGWGRIGAGARSAATSRWKRRAPGAPKGTVLALPAASGGDASTALVQAYARAGGTPPGYVKSGPHVGPQRPWPKSEFAQRMAAAKAAKKQKAKSKKQKAQKTGKKAARKATGGSGSGQPPRAKSSPRRRRSSWPRAGKNKRTFGIEKFSVMNRLGVPPNHPSSKEKRLELRQAAGRGITAKDIFNMVDATNMKAWVCAGRVRTGCGGGSKMLKGSHQIGVFAAPKKG